MQDHSANGSKTSLLAVDLGVRTGLALFDRDGKLVWYRSSNFGSATRLKAGIPGLLRSIAGLSVVVLEGGGDLGRIWTREAGKLGIRTLTVSAEEWRRQMFYERHRRTGADAKARALRVSRNVIGWSGAPRPTSLRHDAAEAILIGFWGVVKLGWIDRLPPEIRE